MNRTLWIRTVFLTLTIACGIAATVFLDYFNDPEVTTLMKGGLYPPEPSRYDVFVYCISQAIIMGMWTSIIFFLPSMLVVVILSAITRNLGK